MKHNIIIGILTYMQVNLLSQCLESIYRNTNIPGVHLVVANNSENEDTIKNISDICSVHSNLTLLNFRKNLGTSAAWNIITRHYDNDITVILNDDIMVYPYWLEVTKFILEKNSDVGSVSYDLWYTDNPFNYNVPTNAKIWANESIYPLGAAFAFRREVFDKIGEFDEQFFIGLEEVDFGIRSVKAGYFNYVVGTHNEQGINEYRFIRHIGGATGYAPTDSGEKWVKKWPDIPPSLNPGIEDRLKKERNKSINLILPRISNGNIL